MENPIKMDDLGVPLFLETPIWGETKIGDPAALCECLTFWGLLHGWCENAWTVMFQELKRPRMRVQNDKSTNGITSYLLDRFQDLVWGPLIKHFPNILGDVCFPLKRSSNHWQLHGFCKKITVFCYRIWRFGLNSWIFPGNIEVHQDTYMGTNIFHFQHIFFKAPQIQCG